MKILIIRHGDPNYEIDNLTEKGRREVELLSQKLSKEHISKIYCSPLGRARATAKPTAEKLGLEPEILDWLQEFPEPANPSYSPDDTCPWNMPPLYWSKFDNVYSNTGWAESELFKNSTIPTYYKHVCDEFDKLTAKHGYTKDGQVYRIDKSVADEQEIIAIFCHLGLGNCILSHVTGFSLAHWWHTIFLPTSSVTTIFMEKHIPDMDVAIGRLVGIGDTSHLFAGGEPVSSSGLMSPLHF